MLIQHQQCYKYVNFSYVHVLKFLDQMVAFLENMTKTIANQSSYYYEEY